MRATLISALVSIYHNSAAHSSGAAASPICRQMVNTLWCTFAM